MKQRPWLTRVRRHEYGTISGTSHSDMGLMAETTYYYRVSATNSVGMGDAPTAWQWP